MTAALRRSAARTEDVVATLAFAGVILLPLIEIVLRPLGTGIPGSVPFAQRLTMWVGLLGAAIAAREGKLLSLATATFLPAGRPRYLAEIAAAFVTATIATVLAFGGYALVLSERGAETIIAIGVPEWIAFLALPYAFALIALRAVWRAGTPSSMEGTPAVADASASATRAVWTARIIAAAGLAAGWWMATHFAWFEGRSVWPWLLGVILGAVLGAPIFVLLGGCALVLFFVDGGRPISPLIDAGAQLTSPSLAAIPLFTLAGYFLAEGHASSRLLRLFRAFLGWMPGGTAIVTAALCAFFTTFTGGSGVTILALGGLLMPALVADRYSEKFSLGLLTSAGSLGLLFPPALPLILYAIIAEIAMEDLFLGGLMPGLLLLVMLAGYGVREGMRSQAVRTRFSAGEARAALWAAKWELLLPVIVLGALVSGLGRTVESAALAALYAFVVQRYIHRDLASAADVIRVVRECLTLVGGVLIILAVAVGLTNYMVDAQVPAKLVEWTTGNIHSKAAFLLALNVFLLVVGSLMDIFSAIVVVVPLIVPIAREFDVHPVHLGIIFIANLELGYLTPPVGLNLFLSAYRFNKPVMQVARASFPMLIILLIGVLLITYVPWMTLALVE